MGLPIQSKDLNHFNRKHRLYSKQIEINCDFLSNLLPPLDKRRQG